jgi:hypothetical protein
MTTQQWLDGKAWTAGQMARVVDGEAYPLCTVFELVERKGGPMAKVKLLAGPYTGRKRVVGVGSLRPTDGIYAEAGR